MRLLRHIVEKTACGDRDALKEYSLGLDVFDRDPSFDPKADSIVRSTVRQLRLKLAEYYEAEGRENNLRIRLPKGSYIAQIEEREPPAVLTARVPDPAAARPWRLLAVTALVITVGVAGAIALSHHYLSRTRTVVVLPFRNLSADPRLGYIGDGLREGLTSALVHTKGIEVMARASWPQVASRAANPTDAARAANAETVITGSISPQGDGFQTVVNLIDGRSGKFLWSQTYEGKAADLIAIEQRALAGVAGALGASLKSTGGVPAPPVPRNREALELYLKACSLAHTNRAANMREAGALFERALVLEPDFARGYASAATNYLVAVSNGLMTWSEAGPRGVELARKAVALDPALAEAHSALGLGLECEWNWKEAGAELSRAIELDPRYPAGYFGKAVDLAVVGRFADAERTLQLARMLDPTWDAPDALLGELYYYTRRWDDVLKFARRGRASQPSDAEFYDNLLAKVYIARDEPKLARPFLSAHPGAYDQALVRAIDGDPEGGWRDLLALRRSSGETAFRLASYAAAELSDHAVALDWLEQSFRDHEPDLVSLVLDPVFDSIRQEPRALAIRREIHLAEWPVWYAENYNERFSDHTPRR